MTQSPLELAVGTDEPKIAPATFISVVVPVRNEAASIRRTLGQLVAQRYDSRRFEVLVVDGQSTDETPALVQEFVRRHENVRLLFNPRRWSSAGRNVGVRHARGDVVVIVDGHCELDDRFLDKLAAAFEHSSADCLGRTAPQDVSTASVSQRAIAAARRCWLGHHPDSFVYCRRPCFVPAKSVAAAYHRRVFATLGYFDENFDACEDVEFNHRIDRAGLSCYFTPELAVRYWPRASLGGLFRQMFRYGRGRVRLLRKHPDTLCWKSLLPGAFVLGCLAGPALAWLSTWLAGVYLASLAAYGLIVLGTSAAVAVRRRDAAIFPWLPLVFSAIHAGAGAGILLEVLDHRRRCAEVAPVRSPQPQESVPRC